MITRLEQDLFKKLDIADSQNADLTRQLEEALAECRKWKERSEDTEREISAAIKVLSPNMPESGIEDAARQVKQVAVMQAENCELMNKKLAAKDTEIAALRDELREAITYFPDSLRYKYAWGECLSDEQDMVKEVRERLAKLIGGE